MTELLTHPTHPTGYVSAEDNQYDAILNTIKTLKNGDKRLTVLVPDIRCANCALSIEDRVTGIVGVRRCRTNVSEHRVTIDYVDIPPAQLLTSLDDLGYKPCLDRSDQMEQVFREQKKSLLGRIGVAGIGMMQVMMYALAGYLAGDQGIDVGYETLMRWASLLIATPVAFYSALPFHQGAWKDLKQARPGMDVPVSLAILAAWTLSTYQTLAQGDHVYFDSVCMFAFFLLVGRYLELNSRHKYQQSQSLAENLLPATALILDEDARKPISKGIAKENTQEVSREATKRVAVEKIRIGDRVVVRKGEVIPVDGRVIEGVSSIDESAFTGEPMPVTRHPGQTVLAGSTSLDAELIVEAGAEKENLVINRISALFRESTLYRPQFSLLADRVARYFVAAILLLAGFSGLYWYLSGYESWFVVSLTVLVVSCPCALSLATPIAYTVAASALRNAGVVLANGSFLERLAETDTVVFDKTGTITSGDLKNAQTRALNGASVSDCVEIAAALEANSPHPIAKAFATVTNLKAENLETVPGQGIRGRVNGREYRIGKPGFVSSENLTPPDAFCYWILLGNEEPLCWFGLIDKLRAESSAAIQQLKRQVKQLALFTGDSSATAAAVAASVDIEDCRKGMSPEDKLVSLMDLQNQGGRVLMVGDGINDTGAMGVADTSIAVSPVDVFVQSAADATLLNNNLAIIPALIRFSRKVRRVIRQNILWAVFYNLSVIPLAVAGYLLPWMAALGMSMSSLVVVFNANRVYRVNV